MLLPARQLRRYAAAMLLLDAAAGCFAISMPYADAAAATMPLFFFAIIRYACFC